MISKKDYISISLLFIATIIFFYPVIFFNKIYFFRDLTYIFHPWKTFAAESIQRGEIPLWNPYVFCGMPFLANWQSAVFYPFSMLFYILSFPIALKIYDLLHIFLAGLGTYLFARKIGFKISSATGMMFIFSLNGYIITKLEFLSHIGVDIWIFYVLLFIKNPILLGIVISFMFLSGHYIVFIALTIILIMSVIFSNETLIDIKNFLYGIFLSLVISSIQLLPTIELSFLTSRLKEGIDQSIIMTNSITFGDLFRFLSPLFPSSTPIISGEKFPWNNSFHIGFIGSLIALLGTAIQIKRKKLLTLIIIMFIIIGISLSLGSSLRINLYIIKYLFIFKYFRYPFQFMLIPISLLTILVGYGLNNIKKSYLISLIILVELLLISYNFQYITSHDFYYYKSKNIEYLQRESTLKRFILTPQTETNRLFKNTSIIEAWKKSKELLYNLTCMPFHLLNAYGSGEPLTLDSLEKVIDLTYEQKTPQEALPYFEYLGVNYLISKDKLKNSLGYLLIQGNKINIYQTNNPSELYWVPNISDVKIKHHYLKPGKIKIEISVNKNTPFIYKESFMPGWKSYTNMGRIETKNWQGLFRYVLLEPNIIFLIQIYQPVIFLIGILITISSIISLSIFCIIKFNTL